MILIKILTAYHSDIGIEKETNQDALLIKTASTPRGKVSLIAICDGMGGLTQGELASATVIQALGNWFEEELPELLSEDDFSKDNIISQLERYMESVSDKILSYGDRHGIQLGTTVTAFLILRANYYIFHVGDSRAYEITDEVIQLTTDQTLVERELSRGNITKEHAKNHPQGNVLLQSVGASKQLDIAISEGTLKRNAIYMLCTDGLYNKLDEEELENYIRPTQLSNFSVMEDRIFSLVELVKSRRETDNISAILVKVY